MSGRYPTVEEHNPDYAYEQDTNEGGRPSPTDMVDSMSLDEDDCWRLIERDGEVHLRILGRAEHDVRVTDPTYDDAAHVRSGEWWVPLTTLYERWRRGELIPTTDPPNPTPKEPDSNDAFVPPEIGSDAITRLYFTEEGMYVEHRTDGELVDEVAFTADEMEQLRERGAEVTLGDTDTNTE